MNLTEMNLFMAYENDKQFVRSQSFTTNSFHSGGNFGTTGQDRTN